MAFALITGASKGIGRAVAYELAKRNFNLVLIARSEPELKTLCSEIKNDYKVEATYFPLDLTLPDAAEQILKWIEEKNIPLNVLINNAGYGLWGGFDELTLEEQLNMMQINMICIVKLSYLLLPLLKKQSQSYILNVASTASYQAVPRLNVYSASKAFVVQFSRALKYELKESNVSVTCISPGSTATNFMDRAGMKTEEMKKRADKFNMKVEDVATFAVEGMLNKKTEIIPGFINKVSVAFTYFVPKWITEKIAAGLYKK
jgi:short-subunit dehydrogenase